MARRFGLGRRPLSDSRANWSADSPGLLSRKLCRLLETLLVARVDTPDK